MNTKMNSVPSLIDFYSYFLSERCRRRYNRCLEDCKSTRDRALRENDLRRTSIEFQRRLDLIECWLTNQGNKQAISRCQAEINEAAEANLTQIDALDLVVRIRYRRCTRECKRQGGECEGEFEYIGEGMEGPVVIEVGCIEGHNAPCFKSVLDICTEISDPCDDCSRSLCSDDSWSFESDIPLNVTLVVATNLKTDARVIATSIKDGKQAVLLVPRSIRLRGMEQLYLGFSSSEKPAGPVKVLMYRN